MEYLFGIIILLGVLVFFHEFGHFIVSKFFGVKVEVFSLGFGPKIVKKKMGETQYCISLIPLGGYVKLYGEDPTAPIKGADAKRSFSNQPVWNRIAIAAAGPIFNFILAVFVFFVIEVAGLEKVATSYLAHVNEGSQAWQLGLRSGDTVTQVNQKKISRFREDLLATIAHSRDQDITLTIQRRDQSFDVTFKPEVEEDWNMYCEKVKRGVLKGISELGPNPTIGITNLKSWAAFIGLKNGDRIISLNGVPINYWYQLKEYLLQIVQKELTFKVRRGDKDLTIQSSLPPEYFLLSVDQKERFLGLYSYEFFVKQEFVPGTAGARAGLKVGDRLVAINDIPIGDWDELKESIQKFGKDPGHFYLTYDRAGALNRVQVVPAKIVGQHPCGTNEEIYQIGIVGGGTDTMYTPPKFERYYVLNPFRALYSATAKSVGLSYIILKTVGKLITGNIPLKAVGGPILIGKVAGDSLKQGLFPFLMILAMISINLAVLNILPIPVMDGGHLFFFLCEVIRGGKPLSNKVLEFANRAGVAFLLVLLLFVFYNDISRYWMGILSFFKKMAGII
ncbi:MAG: RIP metalloprotease RseP [Deltaproteobacteria bacterium GWA2_38_16]|nr:MAG: RIP metalloprotease RseP [Deltaproteobacteria bacterium GWA2_38_16]OGQ02829.1 MAG: RIP metalloprotease RseP [Deltaproteobacteria bacterium RIFCSPHIGHO2_02_FULL_38_15]OGQ34918.1 MAG: RIP metalloprotease RseP [Deltaproteobacteria bacterium RIFCSPLOWO2_01_FULL_38_9]HBQ21673.1 RIP metalloprotease RseP [Deltaproteobacteria bacterium]